MHALRVRAQVFSRFCARAATRTTQMATTTADEHTSTATTSVNPMDLVAETNQFVLPGDLVGKIKDLKMRIGPGLTQNKEMIYATKAGFLRYSSQHKFYWIENNQKRYVPSNEDMVIGIVLDKYHDHYKVDIDGSMPATLSVLAFEGATLKNKLAIPVGAPVYARVAVANKDMEPEIVCMSQKNKADGYGELQTGFMFQVSIGYAKTLLDQDAFVLTALGRRTPFEIAVGMNGRVWVNTPDIAQTIVIANTIMHAEFLRQGQITDLVDRLWLSIST